jgi:hypothetical protein
MLGKLFDLIDWLLDCAVAFSGGAALLGIVACAIAWKLWD